MSFILDALRKSESERQREPNASLSRAPLAPVRHQVPPWTWLLIGLLSLALIAFAVAWWQSNRPLQPAAAANRMTGPAAPAAEAPDAAASGATQQTAPVLTQPLTPQTVDADPLPVRPISELYSLEPALPEYRVDLIAHNSQDPGRGSAWINGRRYYVGERIGAGPALVEVQPDGVVLEHAGARYLLTTR